MNIFIFRDAIPSPSESLATSSVASSPSLSTFDEVVSTTRKISNPNEQGPSFAEMLRNTGARFKAGRSWPSVKPTLPERSKSVRSDIEEDDCAHAPSYSQSFGDALAQALEQTKLLNAGMTILIEINIYASMYVCVYTF